MVKRTVRVTQKHNDDAKKLLRLMGVPIVEAPGEAEAQCAAMAKAGVVRTKYFSNVHSQRFSLLELKIWMLLPLVL